MVAVVTVIAMIKNKSINYLINYIKTFKQESLFIVIILIIILLSVLSYE